MARTSRNILQELVDDVPRIGRPRLTDKGAVVKKIIRVATALFLRQGFDATTMDGVTEAARISKATLYSHFPSKELLFLEVIRIHSADWEKKWQDLTYLEGDLRSILLHDAIFIMEDTADKNAAMFEQIIMMVSAVQPHLKSKLNTALGYRQMRRRLVDDILRGTANEGITIKDPQILAEMFFGMLYGWLRGVEKTRKVSKKERLAYCEQAVDVLIAAKHLW